jgi:hypothetical protein
VVGPWLVCSLLIFSSQFAIFSQPVGINETRSNMRFSSHIRQLNLLFAFNKSFTLVLGVAVETGRAAHALLVFFTLPVDLGNR